MNLFIGTSGFAYKEWIGTFYPKGLSSSGMLRYYGEAFRAVEINNTFYRAPTEPMLREWAADVPDGFLFALKAPQLITHRKRLRDAGESVSHFFQVTRALESRLGPVLFQLPPNFRKDLPRLERFLERTPRNVEVTIEFRHESWFEEEVLDVLRDHGVALCVAHGEALDTPPIATADWGYLRLREVGYDDGALHEWARFIRAQDWSKVHVYFKHEDTGTGPVLARRLEEIFRSDGA